MSTLTANSSIADLLTTIRALRGWSSIDQLWNRIADATVTAVDINGEPHLRLEVKHEHNDWMREPMGLTEAEGILRDLVNILRIVLTAEGEEPEETREVAAFRAGAAWALSFIDDPGRHPRDEEIAAEIAARGL